MRNTLTDQHIESENDGKLAIILFTTTTSSCDRIAMHFAINLQVNLGSCT
jgi:hypothetical protein